MTKQTQSERRLRWATDAAALLESLVPLMDGSQREVCTRLAEELQGTEMDAVEHDLRLEIDAMRQVLCAVACYREETDDPILREMAERAGNFGGLEWVGPDRRRAAPTYAALLRRLREALRLCNSDHRRPEVVLAWEEWATETDLLIKRKVVPSSFSAWWVAEHGAPPDNNSEGEIYAAQEAVWLAAGGAV